MPHLIDIPFVPPKLEQVVFAPTGSASQQDLSTVDLTNQSELFKAISAGIKVTQQSALTGAPIQHKERYNRAASRWTLKLSKQGYLRVLESKVLVFADGTPLTPDIEPILSEEISGHIVVHLLWNNSIHFLCKPSTKTWITKMRMEINPHRSPISNGQTPVQSLSDELDNKTPSLVRVGVTIPVLHIDATDLEHIGKRQEPDLLRAGISDVEFIYETDGPAGNINGLPAGLIQQINYTLASSESRASGSMIPFDIPFLKDEYKAYIDDIRTLIGKDKQPDKVYYTGKLTSFQEDVYPMWEQIVDDFNQLKLMFMDGVTPVARTGTGLPGTPGFQFFNRNINFLPLLNRSPFKNPSTGLIPIFTSPNVLKPLIGSTGVTFFSPTSPILSSSTLLNRTINNVISPLPGTSTTLSSPTLTNPTSTVSSFTPIVLKTTTLISSPLTRNSTNLTTIKF